jgi:hypothetical protein
MESYVLSVLAQAPHAELPAPAIVIGGGAFAALLVLLLITLAIGKGRPHS